MLSSEQAPDRQAALGMFTLARLSSISGTTKVGKFVPSQRGIYGCSPSNLAKPFYYLYDRRTEIRTFQESNDKIQTHDRVPVCLLRGTSLLSIDKSAEEGRCDMEIPRSLEDDK